MADQNSQDSLGSKGLSNKSSPSETDLAIEGDRFGNSAVLTSLHGGTVTALPFLNRQSTQEPASLALLAESSTRFQLPRIFPTDGTPRQKAETEDSLSSGWETESSSSEAAIDPRALLSDLLDRLEEAASGSPVPVSQSALASSSKYFAQRNSDEDEDNKSEDLQALKPYPGSAGASPLSGAVPSRTFTLSKSYRVLVDNCPSTCSEKSLNLEKNSTSSQAVEGSCASAKADATPPVTPQPKRCQERKDLTPVLSPFLFGPLPTPTAHRQFITTSPSQSLALAKSASPHKPTPTSPPPQTRQSLRKGASTRSRLHLSDLFKKRQSPK
ncbi:hypothetical protein N7539_001169 [Penicillium diatomitis]|uniref:Uncharacterized protein n=1 Tax=Penicillium diatomitis TaxID=2819901 RepID=A0A9W9XN41_9EURO|nr:uncharacterized protein N7539_001169 [Penicillium diatomitis]KAJ5496053.1 hypothetical protein N7539_001169 [Penicillium diatomitis]